MTNAACGDGAAAALEAAWSAHIQAVEGAALAAGDELRALEPGVSEAALDAMQAELGFPLPEMVRALWRRHDGGESPPDLFCDTARAAD